MSKVSSLQTALCLLIRQFPSVEDMVFIFGASPRRPQHVYQIIFPHGRIATPASEDMAKNRTAVVLSRKVRLANAFSLFSNDIEPLHSQVSLPPLGQVIRALISKGVGSASYTGND